MYLRKVQVVVVMTAVAFVKGHRQQILMLFVNPTSTENPIVLQVLRFCFETIRLTHVWVIQLCHGYSKQKLSTVFLFESMNQAEKA